MQEMCVRLCLCAWDDDGIALCVTSLLGDRSVQTAFGHRLVSESRATDGWKGHSVTALLFCLIAFSVARFDSS